MYFTSLRLKGFRNYKEEIIYFHPDVNVFRGDNGQGKTNILEALYIMSLGKSFRTNKDNEMIMFGEQYCSAKATYVKEDIERSIEIIISYKGKSLIIDDNKAKKSSELIDNVYVVAFTPEDMKIVKDEPERRRRFIDRELCQLRPTYYKNLQRYKKVLAQRNAFLKQGNINNNMLEVWEKSLASYGSKIIKERKVFIDRLKDISKSIHKDITDGKEELEISYEASILESDKNIEDEFLKRLRKERDKDIYRGITGSGPHRDDIKIEINNVDARNFGSQGQQRTAALSMKLAEIQMIKDDKGESPALLLDDVLSELDEKRQEYLLKSLSGVQLFITTAETKESLWMKIDGSKMFDIMGGEVKYI